MGKQMKPVNLSFVSFEPRGDTFLAFLPMEGVLSASESSTSRLKEASEVYENALVSMRAILEEMKRVKLNREPLLAVHAWNLGDLAFGLVDNLKRMGMQLNGFYEHLTRDLNVKRKWLEKVIIFRRHLPARRLIPPSLTWGRCDHGTRKIAEMLAAGQKIS